MKSTNDNSGLPVRRALVLGSGGVVGGYWEAGLLRALHDGGVDVFGFDAIVGTSAGAIAATALAHGKLPETPDQTRARRRAMGRSPEPGFAFDLQAIDWDAVMRVFQLWFGVQHSTVEQCAAIGALALQNDRRFATQWVKEFEASLGRYGWGDRKLMLVAVDAQSGERRIFRHIDGIALSLAVAASCAIPGICATVDIDGRFYMDGGVHSSTNADVLVAERPAQVLIATPTNALTTKAGGLAERMLGLEVEALKAIGCDVRVMTPTVGDVERFGTDLMDYKRVDEAYAAGLDAGREWADVLRNDSAIGARS